MKLNALIVGIFSLLASININGQNVMNVPSSIDGEFYGILNQVINGDTTDNGERANLNRVYKLNRGETYFLSGTIFADYPLRITADAADDSNAPPIITSGVGPNGSVVGNDFFTCSNNVSIKNVAIMGTPPTNVGQVNRVFNIIGEATNIVFNNVYFEWGQWLPIGISADDCTVEVRNCYFKNQHNTSDPFNGRALDLRDSDTKKVIFANNTLFNVNSFMIRGEFNTIDEIQIEHNTLVNTLKWPIQWRYQNNVRVANNLFYNVHSYAETSSDRDGQDSDDMNFGIYNIEPIPQDRLEQIGIDEFDRTIDFTNNNWFYSTEVTDYWSEFDLDGEPFMNSRTMSMMNDANYPNITNANTTNLDPTFVNGAGATGLMVAFMKKKRNNQGSLPWGFDDDGVRTTLTWPIIEDLAYTNADLLEGADDGYAIGDLNWFDGEREQWDTEFHVATKDVVYEENILHAKVYPNPAKDNITISYDLKKSNDVKVKIITRDGKVVYEVTEKKSKGSHSQEVDLETLNLATGTYYYIISSSGSNKSGAIYFTE